MYLAKDIDFFYSYDTGEGVEGLSMLAYRRRSKVVWFNEKDNFYNSNNESNSNSLNTSNN